VEGGAERGGEEGAEGEAGKVVREVVGGGAGEEMGAGC
jgi:hypothetical protein